MLKLKFSGYFNNGLKQEKEGAYYNGMNGLLFFMYMFKHIFGCYSTIKIHLFKKNKYNLCFIKSNIRYKVSKHLINRVTNRYNIVIQLNNNVDGFFFGFKNLSSFSSVYINSNYCKIYKINKYCRFFTL